MSNRIAMRRTLIRLVYLLPLLTLFVLVIHAAIPHMFFVHDGVALDTHSSFGLIHNAWKNCRSLLNGTTDGSEAAVYFAYGISFFVILFWVAFVLFAVSAIAAAVCSATAFSYEPQSKKSNRIKRWFGLFCPNRILYMLSFFLPLPITLFPYILLYFYRRTWNYKMSLHFYGLPDIFIGIILTALNLICFLLLLRAQAEEHLDLFRLYKAKTK